MRIAACLVFNSCFIALVSSVYESNSVQIAPKREHKGLMEGRKRGKEKSKRKEKNKRNEEKKEKMQGKIEGKFEYGCCF